MSLQISSIKKAESEEWDHIWKRCEYSTYFHSREWAEIWQNHTKNVLSPKPQLIIFSDGKKALLPLSYRKLMRGISGVYLSSPAGTYGGWVSQDKLDLSHAMLLLEYLTRKIDRIIWRINPFDNLLFEVTRSGLKITQEDQTSVLDLSEDFETIVNKWSKGHRWAAKKAMKENVSVKIATNEDEWKSYYQIYLDTLSRWGKKATSSYNWELFQKILKQNMNYVKLWLAIYEKKPIAGALCFYAKNHCVYWHGAAFSEYFKLHPVQLIFYRAIEDACEKNYKWFDLNPSGGHEGVQKFKNRFGTRNLPCNLVTHRAHWLLLANKFKKKIFNYL